MAWYFKTPIIGPLLLEILHPDRVPSRRYFERQDRSRRIRARCLALLTIATGLLYLAWAGTHLDWGHPLVATLFLGAEAGCLALFLLATINVWALRYKPAEGLPGGDPMSLDVFVTACREPIQVLRKTLTAVARISWRGPLELYLLDDGGSEEARQLAEELGINYLSRIREGLPNTDFKAGNLNYGLSRSDGELVLVVDADQVVDPEIAEKLCGYMRFERVAFVQSKQDFLVPKGDPFFSSDEVFYDAVQIGYDADDTVISCGSGVVYRRAALEEIGGFATWNLVEDLTTSYELHSRGWKSFYYAYPLATGLAPHDIGSVYQQRGQWALDTMRLFVWDNPLFKKGLAWRRKLSYLVICFSYVAAALLFPFFFTVPLWTYLSGTSVFTGEAIAVEFGFLRLLYFAAMAFALRYLFRGRSAGKQFRMLCGLFPIYLRGLVLAFLFPPGRKPRYRTNNATLGKTWRLPAPVALLPQIGLFAANATLPFYALWQGTAEARVILVAAVISTLALWALWHILAAGLGRHKWEEERKPHYFYSTPIPELKRDRIQPAA